MATFRVRLSCMALSALFLLTLTASPAMATATGCATSSPGSNVPRIHTVQLASNGPLPTCAGTYAFNVASAPCPLVAVTYVVVAGALCGPAFAPGATVNCDAKGTFKALVVGWDMFPYNGNIDPTEPSNYNLVVLPQQDTQVKVVAPTPAVNTPGTWGHLIAVPVGPGTPPGITINCN